MCSHQNKQVFLPLRHQMEIHLQAGFTLSELATVLFIIGILLASVLQTQHIITNARIKEIEKDFNGLSAAIYGYQDRYKSLPGDDKQAAKQFINLMDIHNGNGNYMIEGDFDAATGIQVESRKFWLHLRNAGLVGGVRNPANEVSFQQPIHAFNGVTGVSTGAASIIGLFIGFDGIPRDIAVILETRDDGVANKGRIQCNQADYDNEVLYDLYFAMEEIAL